MINVEVTYKLNNENRKTNNDCLQETLLKLIALYGKIELYDLKFSLRHCGVAPGTSNIEIGGLDYSEGKTESVPLHAINFHGAVKCLMNSKSKGEFKFSESNTYIIFECLDEQYFVHMKRNEKVISTTEFDIDSLNKASKSYLCATLNDIKHLFTDDFFRDELLPLLDRWQEG